MTPGEFVEGLRAGGYPFADDDPRYCTEHGEWDCARHGAPAAGGYPKFQTPAGNWTTDQERADRLWRERQAREDRRHAGEQWPPGNGDPLAGPAAPGHEPTCAIWTPVARCTCGAEETCPSCGHRRDAGCGDPCCQNGIEEP